MKEYYVYILRCCDDSYYTGVTNNYELRVGQHNEGGNSRCYTFKRRPVRLVYLSEFFDINEAISWEKQVKRWSRKKKEALIQQSYEMLPQLASNQYFKRIDDMVRRAHHDIVLLFH